MGGMGYCGRSEEPLALGVMALAVGLKTMKGAEPQPSYVHLQSLASSCAGCGWLSLNMPCRRQLFDKCFEKTAL